MVRIAPIGTGQDNQQLKLAYGFLNNKQFSVLTFLVAENIKNSSIHGLGNLEYLEQILHKPLGSE